MTTCIVAQFPWAAITSVTQSEPAGVIVCTDTRVTTTTGSVVEGVWAKQGRLAKNIYVCYTSSHLGATTAALTRVNNTRDVAKIGRALQLVHGQYGGYTELIAVVWPRNQLPEILELMPPQYKPTLRRGIIGIGHRGVLQSFRENFFEQPRPDLVDPLLPEVLERLAQKIGQPLDPPRYRIHDAGLTVAGALAEAIQIRRAPTVSIPIQVTTISNQEVKSYRIASSPDGGKTWEGISAGPHDAKILRSKPTMLPQHTSQTTAEQLFH